MHYRWLVVAYTMLMQAVSYGILAYSFALFVMPWLTTFEADRTQIMVTIFALQIALGLISPFAGRLFDRYASVWLVVSGGLALAAGLALVSVTTHLWQITVLYATVLPVAITLNGPVAAQTIITKWFHDKRGTAIGISAIGTSIGGFLVPMLTAALLASYQWRSTLQTLALLALLAICPLGWLLLRRRPPAVPDPAAAETGAGDQAAAPVRAEQDREWSTREILGTRYFWIPVLALLPINMAFSGVQFNLPAYAQDLGNSVSQSAWLISLMSLSMIGGKLFFGAMSDRMEHRKLYWIAAGLMMLMLVLLQNQPGYPVLLACSVLLGLSVGGLLPLMAAIFGRQFGIRSFGQVIGLVTMILTVGGFGPLIAGAVFDATGNYDAAFMLFLVLLIPAALGMLGMKNR
jgi:MFS family permease